MVLHFFLSNFDNVCICLLSCFSYLLEKSYGWSGLLIEPQRKHFRTLYTRRKAEVIPYCVYNESAMKEFVQTYEKPQMRQFEEFDVDMLSGLTESRLEIRKTAELQQNVQYRVRNIKVPCMHVQDVLDEYEMTYIDYLSIDTEGAEMAILKAIDFDKTSIAIIHGEFRSYSSRVEVYNFLSKLGYIGRPLGHDMCFWREDLIAQHTPKNKYEIMVD